MADQEAQDIPEYPLATLLGGEEGHEIRHDGDFQALTYTSGGVIKRDENQDSAYANAAAGVVAVVDGMGGPGGGREASGAATTAISDGIIDNLSTDEIIGNAKTRIQKLPEENPGVTMAIVRTIAANGKNYLECTNIGDAQIMVFHPQKGVPYVSRDQSKVQALYDMGRITDPLERYTHAENHLVSNAIQKQSGVRAAERKLLEVENGTYVFALTDGITDFVSPEEIVEIVQQYERAAPVKIKELAESRHWKSAGFNVKLNGQMRHANSPSAEHGDNIGIAMMIVGGENPATEVPKSFGKSQPAQIKHPAFYVPAQRVAQVLDPTLIPVVHPPNERVIPHHLQPNRENIYQNRGILGVQFGSDPNTYASLSSTGGQLIIDPTNIGGQKITLNPGEELILGREQLGGNPSISRKHIKVKYLEDSSISVTDLGSSNGTKVF